MKCLYDGCDHEPNRARGLCATHWNYEQYGSCSNGCVTPASGTSGWCPNCKKRGGSPTRRNKGSIVNSDIEKNCSGCDTIFPIEEFFASHHAYRCRDCQNKQKRKDYLKRTYGIEESTYIKMLNSSGGGCFICGKTKENNGGRYLSVDHDHSCCNGPRSCGKCVRGILCDTCNRAVGLLQDNPENAMAVAVYIKNNAPVDRSLLINLNW